MTDSPTHPLPYQTGVYKDVSEPHLTTPCAKPDSDMEDTITYSILQLKALTVTHDRIASQLTILDSKIKNLSMAHFKADLSGNDSAVLQTSRRLSVVKGVRRMYESYQRHSVTKIQELSTLINKTADQDGGSGTTDVSIDSEFPTYSNGHDTEFDFTVKRDLEKFCMSCRHS